MGAVAKLLPFLCVNGNEKGGLRGPPFLLDYALNQSNGRIV